MTSERYLPYLTVGWERMGPEKLLEIEIYDHRRPAGAVIDVGQEETRVSPSADTVA
jgi:hypothetical protein